MPGKQKASRTRLTVALEKTLLSDIAAEVDRRKEAGDSKANQSKIAEEALAWYLQQPREPEPAPLKRSPTKKTGAKRDETVE